MRSALDRPPSPPASIFHVFCVGNHNQSLHQCGPGLQLSVSLPSKDLGYWLLCFSRSQKLTGPPVLSKSEPPAPPRGPHLCALTLVDEEDTGKGVREAGTVSSKEAASLVHVGTELEGLLLCGKSRLRLGEQATSQRALPG